MQIQFKRRQCTDSSFGKASRAVLSKHCPSENTAGSSSLLLPENRAHNSLFAICQCKVLSGSHLWLCTQLMLPQPLSERQPWSDDYRENNFNGKTNTLKKSAQSSCSTAVCSGRLSCQRRAAFDQWKLICVTERTCNVVLDNIIPFSVSG